MKLPNPIHLVVLGLATLILISVFTAFSAGIVVTSPNVGAHSSSVMANDVKPDACMGLNLVNIVSGTGTVTGTSGNDLIVGSASADTIDGLGGDDCILGGGGNDSIDGNTGTDVCLGGSGTNTFTACESENQ